MPGEIIRRLLGTRGSEAAPGTYGEMYRQATGIATPWSPSQEAPLVRGGSPLDRLLAVLREVIGRRK